MKIELFPPDVQNVINRAPESPTCRGLVLKYTGLYLPEEVNTLPAIAAWLEGREPHAKSPLGLKKTDKVFKASVALVETHIYRRRYSAKAAGRGEYVIPAESVLQVARRNGTFLEFVEDMDAVIREWAGDNIDVEVDENTEEVFGDGPEHIQADDRVRTIKDRESFYNQLKALVKEQNPDLFKQWNNYEDDGGGMPDLEGDDIEPH